MIYFFFFNDTATTEIYTLSLHDALPIYRRAAGDQGADDAGAGGHGEHGPHRDDRDGSPDRRVGRDQDAELHRGRAQGQLTSYAATIASRITGRLVRAPSLTGAVDSPRAMQRLTSAG